MRPTSSLPSICARIHDGRRASIVSAIVPGALAGRRRVDCGVGSRRAGPTAAGGAAADSGSGPSRVSAHHSVPTTASAPVAAKRPTNVRADRDRRTRLGARRRRGATAVSTRGVLECVGLLASASASGAGVAASLVGARREAVEEVAAGRGVERERRDGDGSTSGDSTGPRSAAGAARTDSAHRAAACAARTAAVCRRTSGSKPARGAGRSAARLRVVAVVGTEDARERGNRKVARLEVERRERAVEVQLVYGAFGALRRRHCAARLERPRRPALVASAEGASGQPVERSARPRRRLAAAASAGRRFGAERLDFRACLVEHAAHALARLEHHVAREVERVARRARRRARARDRRAGRQTAAAASPGASVASTAAWSCAVSTSSSRRASTMMRRTSRRAAVTISSASRSAACRTSSRMRTSSSAWASQAAALLTVLIEQAGHAGEVGPGRFRRVLIGHD